MPRQGDAFVRLTDRNGKPVGTGTEVQFGRAFGFITTKSYTVGADRIMRIPHADLLPHGTNIKKRSGRASFILAGKQVQTNIFVFPTHVKAVDAGWVIWNDEGPGVIRAKSESKYVFDASGSMSLVEVNPVTTEIKHLDVYNRWFGAGEDDQMITFELTDINGNIQSPATDARVLDLYYARKEGTPVARRHLYAFKDGDTQKQGWVFENDEGRVFSDHSYYVRTKAVKYFFGINGQIQSPVIEISPMPRVPLVKSIKIEGGKAVGEFEELDARYTNKKIAKYVASTGNPNLWVPEYEAFLDAQEIHIAITKENTAYIGVATFGVRNFEFNVSSTPDDLVGLTVFISSPYDFFPATPTEWARPKDQQIHFRPVKLGVIEKHDDKLRIKYEPNLGFTETYVPLKTN